jgi:hypothetical protein
MTRKVGMLALIATFALLSACASPKSKDLTGTYVHRDSNGIEKIVLKADGTFDQSFTPAHASIPAENKGTWKLVTKAEMRNLASWRNPKEKFLFWVGASDEVEFENLWLINHPLGEFNPDFQQHRAGLSTYELRSSGNKFYLSEDAENTIHLDKVD